MALDTSLAPIHPKAWGFSDQLTLGLAYMHAIHFQTYWLAETKVGLGRDQLPEFRDTGVASLNVATGIRHNFLNERWRPFIAGYLHYLQFFSRSDQDKDAFRTTEEIPNARSIWVGLRPAAGIEWFFGDEMSIQAQVDYLLLFNLDYLFRHALMGGMSYHLYF